MGLLLVAGCGVEVDGTAVAAGGSASPAGSSATVPPGLDTGSYSTELTPTRQGDPDSGWINEGNRMLGNLALPYEIDSALTFGVAGQNAVPFAAGNPDGGMPEAFRGSFVGSKIGVSLIRADKPDSPTRHLRLELYRTDKGSADAFVRPLETTGRAAGLRAVSIPGVGDNPVAFETAPATVDAFLDVGPDLVLRVQARSATVESATDLVGRAMARQIAQVRTFTPTATAQIGTSPVDPDGTLARTLAERNLDSTNLRWFGALNLAEYERRNPLSRATIRELRDAGVDSVGWGYSRLFRAESDSTARALVGFGYREAELVAGIPALGDAVQCRAVKPVGGAAQTICDVHVGRYMARIPADNLEQAHQRAAAQWVILTRNP